MKTPLILTLTFALLTAPSLSAMVDHDSNGLSDVFEFVYFNGLADPLGDGDGDGVSNYEESIWGTDPTNAVSAVTGPVARVVGRTVELSWPMAAYRSYELRASDDLLMWRTVASGSISNYIENLGLGDAPSRRFYRLSVALPESGAGPVLTPTVAGQDLVLSWTVANGEVYELQSSGTLTSWKTVSANVSPPVSVPLSGAGAQAYQYYRLKVEGGGGSTSNGLEPWEEELYVAAFGVLPATRDSDGDGQNDLAEFQQGRQPGKKDHPAVGLVVFTPLEKSDRQTR